VFIDSHCHLTLLDLAPYQGDLSLAINAAKVAGVSRMMSISVELDDHLPLSAIAAQFPEVGYSVGVHPCEQPEMMQRASVETLVQLAASDRVWAIGETGLDYYHSAQYISQQQACFIRHIQASQQVNKPLVVHTRSAKQDTIAILRAERAEHGILHCFTEDWETAKAALDLGFYISFSGILSFKNAQDLREVAKQIPLERLLIETDSPYLAPVPYRGKPNEPKYVPYVAQTLAEIYHRPVAEIAQITSDNFLKITNLS
jgi:TatD DNase family protein